MRRRLFLVTAANASLGALLAACGGSGTSATPNATAPVATTGTVGTTAAGSAAGTTTAPSVVSGKPPTTVKVAFSYIPNVQFAPFYLADAKGRFAAEGLKAQFDYGSTTDLMQLTARGERDFLNAGGDEVAVARSQGVPVVYVAAVYQQYPIAVFAPKGKGLADAQSLTKLKVGIPSRNGANYIGLKAILYANKIDESKVNLQEVGFSQAQSIAQGKVDAGVGYVNNDVVQLKAQGVDVDVLRVSDVYNLPSAGIVTSEKMVAERPETVRAFLRAMIAGMRDTQADPKGAFAEVLKIVPEAAKTADVQQQVLTATIDLSGDPAKYGTIDPAAWTRMATFMKETALIKGDPKPEEMFSAKFLP
jgi:NitT/TauT family transport system substrate-binding protein